MQPQLNLPNFLTSIRIALSPVLALLFLYDSPTARYAILFIIILSELTDLFDGYMARKHGQVTDLGKLLDPMADSIYRDTIFLCLAVKGHASLLLVLPILYRDSVISTLRTVCAYKGIVLAARLSGKMKAIFQAITIIIISCLLILALYSPWLEENLSLIVNVLMALVCCVTLYSAYDYLRGLLPHIMQSDEPSHKCDEKPNSAT